MGRAQDGGVNGRESWGSAALASSVLLRARILLAGASAESRPGTTLSGLRERLGLPEAAVRSAGGPSMHLLLGGAAAWACD
ncbi:hypothetical protein NDU88_003853 [Pleurodeles waltl]|uniref:Uncharacterized protein n=1 Tax=Pleurodeles waltl TaxID=8319 RepID=A0AAV7MSA9_PLEWA|nr:hypothetical protein NDU88_003853 [Pleurodeles waltl]